MTRCENEYTYPLDKKWFDSGIKRKILWFLEQFIAGTHKGDLQYSMDIMIPEGTPVYAAAQGKVVWLRDDSNEGGPYKKYWLKGNRIVIKHKNDEYTGYEHLRYRGVEVKPGQNVKTGQLIGYSGNTGYSLLPHLHFEVFNEPDPDMSEGKTLEFSFKKNL
jgi:murein DD-endopeptidase MepM/ murein hydrolase activator NlpD